MEIAEEPFKGHLKMLCKEILFIFKWKSGDSTIWRGKLLKQENGTHSQIPSSKQVRAIASSFQRLKMTIDWNHWRKLTDWNQTNSINKSFYFLITLYIYIWTYIYIRINIYLYMTHCRRFCKYLKIFVGKYVFLIFF